MTTTITHECRACRTPESIFYIAVTTDEDMTEVESVEPTDADCGHTPALLDDDEGLLECVWDANPHTSCSICDRQIRRPANKNPLCDLCDRTARAVGAESVASMRFARDFDVALGSIMRDGFGRRL